MQTPTFPVFVSSTWLDLEPERKSVERAIHRMRETKFVGMEYFGSRDETTRRASLDEVDRSRVYVGIIAARYGSGITEAEYLRARERRLPCFIYFKADDAIADEFRETDPAQIEKLEAFRRELRDASNGHTVSEFDSPDDLAAGVSADLHRWLFDNYLTPKLEEALRGEAPRGETQALLDAVKDLSALGRELLEQLKGKGYSITIGGDFVGRDKVTNIYNTPLSTISSLPIISAQHQLRAPVGDFVGREKEIDTLTDALRRGNSAVISGISGMGGIGKTELALYVANLLRPDYPDAQLLVDMRGTDDKPRDPADALAACVRAFVGLEQKLPESTDDLTGLYREILSRKRALILLDNASDSAQVRLLLPPTGSALLVTSRNTMALPGMKTRLTLEQLPPDKARELLTEIVPRVTPDLADQICYLCGYLPLAVRAAGSLLEVTVDLDPADYAAQLRDERTRLERIGVDPLIGVDVEASFNLSYSLLEPEAASVFRHLAVFPAAFDARAEEYICDDPEHKYLSELVRRSLVLYDVATARYRLHDLVRLFADTELDEDERSWARWGHSAHYLDLLKQVSLLYEHGGEDQMRGLARFHSEWANIECGQAWAAKCMSENEVATRYSTYYAGAFNVLVIRLHPRECMKWIETGLAAARSLNLRSVEAGHLGNLGLLYSYMGEHRRSIEFHEQHLKIARELGDRRAEGMALGNLGHAYHTLGENGRAIEIGKQRLNTIREVGVGRDESNALMGLANAYLFSEQLSLAGELYKQALALARTHGYRDVEGEALANLGTIYLFGKQPEPDKAIELLEQALVVFRDLGKRRDEGHAFICLSDACCLKGDFPRALDYGHQAAAVAGEIGDRFNEGLAFLRIGQALGLLGRRQQAVTYAERALQSLEQLEHPFAATARAVLNALRE